MLEYKNPITIRGAHLTCPLPLALESYWACEADCSHCVGRKLNHIWGEEQRVADPEAVKRKLINGLKKEHKSVLSKALFKKKAFFFGRKADPYQDIELEKRVSKRLIEILFELDWSFAICSKYQRNMDLDTELFLKRPDLINILVEITVGLEADRSLFEQDLTTPIIERLEIAQRWMKAGLNVGVRGEPFIPGYHTADQFRETLKLLKKYGMKSFNIYNMHINDHNIKRLHGIGLDIEKIWTFNQDEYWKPIQVDLCNIAREEGMVLGCPDFVNVPNDWKPSVNTCCGIDVKNAFTFNTHNWRNLKMDGKKTKKILKKTWEGIGVDEDMVNAKTIVAGKPSKDFYTFKNAGLS